MINLIYMAFRTVLKEAFRLGYIPTDPSARVGMLAAEKPKRDVLSIAEARKLFAEEALATVWKGDKQRFTVNLLAACTGMREGEIRGLQVKNVHETHIGVVTSWEQGYVLKGAKWSSERRVVIPSKVYQLLREVISESPTS